MVVETEGKLLVVTELIIETEVAVSEKLIANVNDEKVYVIVVLLISNVVFVIEWW